jgi:DNA-binding FadR family transcriptional regulator
LGTDPVGKRAIIPLAPRNRQPPVAGAMACGNAKLQADRVFEQLGDHIFRGQLQPGEQVLPERDPAQVLGVNPTTVRNAIAILVTIGFLEHR